MSEETKRILRGSFSKLFLEFISEAPGAFVSSFRRESLQRKVLRAGGYDPEKIYGGLANLKHRGLIGESKKGYYFLTEQGKHWARRMTRRYRKIPKARRWDRKWRLVMFDIPQELHYQRVVLRRHLNELGFKLFQKSVFVIPYPCQNEITELCEYLKIGDYVDVVTTSDLGSQMDEFRKHFNL